MNRKIFLGVVVLVLMIIFVAILTGNILPLMIVAPEGEIPVENRNITQVAPLQIELEEISIKEISARTAIIKIAFKISNPNPKSVIVQTLDYRLYETGYSESEQIAGGEIGSRPTEIGRAHV